MSLHERSARTVLSLLWGALGFAGCGASQKGAPTPVDGPAGTPTAAPTAPATIVVATAVPPRGKEPPPLTKARLASQGGSLHRPTMETCSRGKDAICAGQDGCGQHGEACTNPATSCVMIADNYCGCTPGCDSDDDCAQGELCTCAAEVLELRRSQYTPKPPIDAGELHGRCMRADCRTDGDCRGFDGPGFASTCVLAMRSHGCGSDVAFVCAQKGDTCQSDADCKDSKRCLATHAGRVCEHPHECMEGRPHRVDGVAALAPMSAGDSADGAEDVMAGDDTAPSLPTAGPLRAAYEEHASIAAFARTLSELLALGAPTTLLRRTAEAAADEARHTDVALALAAKEGMAAPAPGPFPEALTAPRAADREALAAVLAEDLIAGGCVGETLAATRLFARAERYAAIGDGATGGLYAAIAEDEVRHAALAFDTLAWLHGAYPEAVARPLQAALTADYGAVGETVLPLFAAIATGGLGPRPAASQRV